MKEEGISGVGCGGRVRVCESRVCILDDGNESYRKETESNSIKSFLNRLDRVWK